MRNIRIWLGIIVGAAGLAITTARSAETEKETVFSAMPFDAALKQAATDSKIVLIDFFTTWCGPCKMLDQTTWKDAKVIELLGAKTVPLKIDAEREAKLAKRYKIDVYPTILLVKSDGSEIDRLVGYRKPEKFIEEFTAALAGKNAIARAQEAAQKSEDPIHGRYELGRAFASAGKPEEALREFLWCFDEGMKKSPKHMGVRGSFLLSDIERLGRSHPPALAALRERRDQARQKLDEGSADRSAAADFGSLNRVLNEDRLTLEFYDRLPTDDPRRAPLRRNVFELLLEARRYSDAIQAQPYEQFVEQQERMRTGMAQAAAMHKLTPEMLKQQDLFIVRTWAKELEALAGAGQLDQARALMAKILEIDSSPDTEALMRKHLTRAEHAELFSAPTPAPAK
ncbi:MAG: thioredoxin family protein [Opitutae bacterium]|nr:thioredoxin family protein [Opitutae bacterium]